MAPLLDLYDTVDKTLVSSILKLLNLSLWHNIGKQLSLSKLPSVLILNGVLQGLVLRGKPGYSCL